MSAYGFKVLQCAHIDILFCCVLNSVELWLNIEVVF